MQRRRTSLIPVTGPFTGATTTRIKLPAFLLWRCPSLHLPSTVCRPSCPGILSDRCSSVPMLAPGALLFSLRTACAPYLPCLSPLLPVEHQGCFCVLTLFYGFGTIAFSYSTTFYCHQPAAFCSFLCLCWLCRWARYCSQKEAAGVTCRFSCSTGSPFRTVRPAPAGSRFYLSGVV